MANDYLGNDPDPFIRLMIQRDLGARYGGGPVGLDHDPIKLNRIMV